ncbi:MAG: hypothetical protein KF716_12545 [Anaerolineae bacterium]|nr:hypothetical protein [Anaerolineae bacterium]
MLTFEKLVYLTEQKLAQTDKKIPADVIRDRLQDAGIDEILRQAMPGAHARLIVHDVHIAGEKRLTENGANQPFVYKRKLGTGLWAWIGKNGSGKSTVLNAIIWALTGSDSGLSRRVRSWLHDVLVHFSIGSEEYTSYISRSNDGVSGGIYAGLLTLDQVELQADPIIRFDNRDQMKEAADAFFMQQFGMSSMRWTAHSAAKDDPDLHAHSTTWRTYAHAIHIQDDSYDDLIIDAQKGYGRQDRKILEMMLGVEPAKVVSEIQVQADFAREAFGRARARVSGKQDTLQGQIRQLEQDCLDIDAAIGLMQQDQTPVEDDSVFVKAREQRSVLLGEQNKLAQEIAGLEAQQAQIEQEIFESERTKTAIQEQSEVEYLVNSLAVVRCPHCESAVDQSERLEQQKAQHVCHVCAQPLTRTRTRGDLKVLIKERAQDISALKAAIKRIQQDISERQQKLTASREETAKLGKELEQNVTQARRGFTESYASLLVRKGQNEGQLEQLRRNLGEIEAERTEVETAATWHLILQTAAEIADEYVFDLYKVVYNELSRLVVHLATQFGVPDLERVEIDEKRYIKIYQGGVQLSHNDLARSERVKFKVAFHLALMLLQVRSGLGKHPGFLIIDTPGTAEVNDADFVAMNRDLANIHAEYGDQIQILLATARPEALAHLPPDVTEQPAALGTFF